MITVLTRQYQFRALHHLGREAHHCHTVHGHNYFLQVSVQGIPHPQSGLLFRREDLDHLVHTLIIDPWDRQNLNDVTASKTSGEALASEIFTRLHVALGAQLVKVAVQETRKNRFVATAPSRVT